MENFKSEIELLKRRIECADKIGIISHIKPDGDSVGSLLALGTALESVYADKVDILKSDDIPNKFDFLVNYSNAIEPSSNDIYDMIVILDCGDEKRIGRYQHLLKSAFVVNIDHHISNTYFGDINIVVPNASSTGEVIYEILNKIDLAISCEMATCLYVAISTDTGSFKYDNTSKRTHFIAGELIDKGIDQNKITKKVYQNKKLEDAMFFINTLKNIEFYYDNKLAIVLSDDNDVNAETEGIVEYARDINTVEVACFIKKSSDNKSKVSMRSKSIVDVAKVAQKFGGGGHIRAAGCTLEDQPVNVKDKIIAEFKKHLG